MKHFLITMCMVLLTLFAVTGYSQNRQAFRPSLFTGFPAIINCTEAQLSSLFTNAMGQNINLSLASNFTLSGPVTSNLVKYSNLQTIIIKLPAFKNTLFSLSKQTDQNNNNTYVGKILNPLYADGFELKHNGGGNYQLVKINVEKILVNCNQ
ncbi:MAG: hypothetical protein ABI707_16710 [Ferruginibacter sp.]